MRSGGRSPRDVLSTRSRAYRERAAAIDGLDDDELIEAIVAEPTLLRRPLVMADGTIMTGFDRSRLAGLAAGTPDTTDGMGQN